MPSLRKQRTMIARSATAVARSCGSVTATVVTRKSPSTTACKFIPTKWRPLRVHKSTLSETILPENTSLVSANFLLAESMVHSRTLAAVNFRFNWSNIGAIIFATPDFSKALRGIPLVVTASTVISWILWRVAGYLMIVAGSCAAAELLAPCVGKKMLNWVPWAFSFLLRRLPSIFGGAFFLNDQSKV